MILASLQKLSKSVCDLEKLIVANCFECATNRPIRSHCYLRATHSDIYLMRRYHASSVVFTKHIYIKFSTYAPAPNEAIL